MPTSPCAWRPTAPLIVIAVVGLKGGLGKTTSAAFILHVLAERKLRVLGLDLDTLDDQETLMSWHRKARFEFPVATLPPARGANVDRELADIADGRYDAVVLDAPGTGQGRPITLACLVAATHVLVPVAPTPAENERLPALRRLLTQATAQRPGKRAPRTAVLQTRTIPHAASTTAFRSTALADGWHVLRPTVGTLQRFALAQGMPVVRADATVYGEVVDELLGPDLAPRIAS